MKRVITLLVLAVCLTLSVSAQRINLKTNALYWAAETPNIGMEFRMNRHLTLNMEAMTSFMNIKDYKVKGYAFTPEMRYWLSARPQAGHFIGLMGVAADYDLTHKQCHHDGDALAWVSPTATALCWASVGVSNSPPVPVSCIARRNIIMWRRVRPSLKKRIIPAGWLRRSRQASPLYTF